MFRAVTALVCACLVSILGVLYQNETQRNPRIVYGRFSLPAFDAWVYVAMAENPSVFTVAPWGYRWLSPAVVSVLPTRTVTAGFRVLTVVSLALAGVLLHLYLRRIGVRPWMAALAVLAFVFSTSVGDIVRYRYLVDPLTVALWIAFLWAVESVAPLGIVALLAVLGVLSKDVFFLGIPQLLAPGGGLDRRTRAGRFGVALVAALLARGVLHTAWPAAPSVGSTLGPSFVWAAATEVAASWREWIGPLSLAGLMPLAILTLLRPVARAYAWRNAYLILATLALPFAAGAYTGDGRVVDFYGDDIARLLVYALPWVLGVIALGLGGIADDAASHSERPWPRGVNAVGLVAAGLVFLGLAVGLDRYRRADLGGTRDGPLVLAACRESLRVGRLLEQGRPYEYDFERQGLPHYGDEPARLDEARWFLRNGFGDREQKATGVAVLHQPVANLLVPVLTPRDVALTLAFVAPMAAPVSVAVNGREVGELRPGSEVTIANLTLPAASLFRGDNVVSLRRSADGDPPAIRRLSLR